MTPETPEARLARPEAESEAAFRKYRSVFYRILAGELKTRRRLVEAEEEMECAVIRAGNAYLETVGGPVINTSPPLWRV
jgi:hypothetical protein